VVPRDPVYAATMISALACIGLVIPVVTIAAMAFRLPLVLALGAKTLEMLL